MQINLITHTKTLINFSPITSCDVNNLFVDGHVRISHDPVIPIFGGYSASVIDDIHIFNTSTRKWTLNPKFLFPHGSFA